MARPNTGHVNFQDYFSANESEADEEAQRLEKEAQKKLLGAQQKRDDVVSSFKSAANQNFTNSGGQKTNIGTGSVPANYSSAQLADVEKGIGYQGFNNLGEVSGMQDARDASGAAKSYLTALTSDAGRQAVLQDTTDPEAAKRSSGAQRFSAALSGAAGGDRFARLKAYFDPDKDLKAEEAKATQLAATKKKEAEDLKTTFGKMKGAAKTREDADAAAADIAAQEREAVARFEGLKKERDAYTYEQFQKDYPISFLDQLSPFDDKVPLSKEEFYEITSNPDAWKEIAPALARLRQARNTIAGGSTSRAAEKEREEAEKAFSEVLLLQTHLARGRRGRGVPAGRPNQTKVDAVTTAASSPTRRP